MICDDPDAPRGTWVHWVLFNVPAQARELAEAVPTTEVLDTGAIRAIFLHLKRRNQADNVGR